jgi:hypothetical protein
MEMTSSDTSLTDSNLSYSDKFSNFRQINELKSSGTSDLYGNKEVYGNDEDYSDDHFVSSFGYNTIILIFM